MCDGRAPAKSGEEIEHELRGRDRFWKLRDPQDRSLSVAASRCLTTRDTIAPGSRLRGSKEGTVSIHVTAVPGIERQRLRCRFRVQSSGQVSVVTSWRQPRADDHGRDRQRVGSQLAVQRLQMKYFDSTIPVLLINVALFVGCGDNGDSDEGGESGGSAGASSSSAGSTGTPTGTSGSSTASTAGSSNVDRGGSSTGGAFGMGGFTNSADCPATAPEDGAACTPPADGSGGDSGRGGLSCSFDDQFCSCRTGRDGGDTPTWRCFDGQGQGGSGRGGFGQGGFGQGGFGQGEAGRGGAGRGGSSAGDGDGGRP
jgi:hypothetical protein